MTLSPSRPSGPPPARDLLAQTAHRPWPLPNDRWVMAQSWDHLLFAHWAFPAGAIRPLLPPGLTLDLYDGQAWVGIVPFGISDLHARGLPVLPFFGGFVELNVRTYVVAEDKPGVWFFSLDASSRLAVEGARALYHLPYFNAKMRMALQNGDIHFNSERRDRRAGPGGLWMQYRPTSEAAFPAPGSFDHWLTERYCLYAASRGSLYRADIHHPPWALQQAEAQLDRNTAAEAHRIFVPGTAPLLHYSHRQDVLVWLPERVKAQARDARWVSTRRATR